MAAALSQGETAGKWPEATPVPVPGVGLLVLLADLGSSAWGLAWAPSSWADVLRKLVALRRAAAWPPAEEGLAGASPQLRVAAPPAPGSCLSCSM